MSNATKDNILDLAIAMSCLVVGIILGGFCVYGYLDSNYTFQSKAIKSKTAAKEPKKSRSSY
jgi:hypothetical protein